jgi:ABC-2 type transport system permease protein
MNSAMANSSTMDEAPARGFEVSALAELFVLTLRQHLRGRRLLVLALLFLLPSALSIVFGLSRHPPQPQELEFGFIFNFIPHALATLTALLYAAGMIQDEVEEQTLTYLLLRPLPRWALYLTKFTATVLVTSGLTVAFTTLTYVVIWWNTPELWSDVPERALKTAAVMALAQVGYCSLFGAFGLLTRRALIAGLIYIVACEGILASFDSVIRTLTVNYYFRVLTVRWVQPPETRPWALNLDAVPSTLACVLTVLGVSAVLILLGAAMMQRREFRMKTPEGS